MSEINIEIPALVKERIKILAQEAATQFRVAMGPSTTDATVASVFAKTISAYAGHVVVVIEGQITANLQDAVKSNTRRIVLEVFDRFMEGRQ